MHNNTETKTPKILTIYDFREVTKVYSFNVTFLQHSHQKRAYIADALFSTNTL